MSHELSPEVAQAFAAAGDRLKAALRDADALGQLRTTSAVATQAGIEACHQLVLAVAITLADAGLLQLDDVFTLGSALIDQAAERTADEAAEGFLAVATTRSKWSNPDHDVMGDIKAIREEGRAIVQEAPVKRGFTRQSAPDTATFTMQMPDGRTVRSERLGDLPAAEDALQAYMNRHSPGHWNENSGVSTCGDSDCAVCS